MYVISFYNYFLSYYNATVMCMMSLHLAYLGLVQMAIVMLLTMKVGNLWRTIWNPWRLTDYCPVFTYYYYHLYQIRSASKKRVVELTGWNEHERFDEVLCYYYLFCCFLHACCALRFINFRNVYMFAGWIKADYD